MLIGHIRMGSFSSMREDERRARALVGVACAAIAVVVLSGTAEAQQPPSGGAAPAGEVEGELGTDPGLQRPVFGAVQIGGELGTNYNVGVGLGVFGTLAPGVVLGGWAYLAPIVYVAPSCNAPCGTSGIVLGRAMAELHLGTPYADYRKGLAWFGVGAGVAYETGLRLDPSPLASVAIGGDIRLSRSVWLEIAPRFTWTQWLGGGAYSYANFMGAMNLGVRVDFKR
jgi:hypothetical protein